MSLAKKNIIGIAGIAFGLVFTALVSWQLYRVQKYSIVHDFSDQITSHAGNIRLHMDLNAEVLHSLKALFDGSEEVTEEEFSRSVYSPLTRHQDILSLEWIVRIRRDDRAEVEKQLRERGQYAGITELTASGNLIEAEARDVYFTTMYTEPLTKYSSTLGFDQLSEASRADLITRARDSAGLAMSSKVDSLIQSNDSETVLLALPIYRGPTTTVLQRRESLQGVVLAQIDLGRLVRNRLNSNQRWVFSYELLDVTDSGSPISLIRSGSPAENSQFNKTVVEMGGRTWKIRADIDPEIYLHRQFFFPLLVFLAGTGLFGILAFSLIQSNRQRKLIEAEVVERTRSLDEANKKLATLSTTDDLTGLQNRRSAYNNLKLEWQRHIRDGLKLSAMMIDIDYFKNYNDTYGHLAGDQCLKTVADVLAAEINRPADIVARYGGEEFLAILPNTDEESDTLAERCRKSVERLRISHEKSAISDYVTISIGIATLIPDDSNDMSDLIEKADLALYEAKTQGRNRVAKG